MDQAKTTVIAKSGDAKLSLTRDGNKITLEMTTNHGRTLTLEKEQRNNEDLKKSAEYHPNKSSSN